MTAFLERLLGRLPIGWLQLKHNRQRFVAALAGVSFATVLVLVQLGFLGALVGSIKLPYDALDADLMISASDMNTLADGGPVPRQRMYESLATTGVASATPLYYAKVDWRQADGTMRTLDVFGVDPAGRAFRTAAIQGRLAEIAAGDVALIDDRTRNVPASVFRAIAEGRPLEFETRNRTLTVVGVFRIGGGFTTDGYLVVSDQTFLRLFPQRAAGAPNHILVKVEPGSDVRAVADRLRAALPAYDTIVRPVAEAVSKDQSFQTTQRPVGLIFGFGVVIGLLVGLIIVYQVLSSDVADHLKEYATFKAIGYPQSFFTGVIFEEAIILAVFGFIPGFLIATALYAAVAAMTGLPLAMTAGRAIAVLAGSIAMCAASGAIATRKLARADPADLF